MRPRTRRAGRRALGLQKLLTKAGKADEKQRLNAPLATIQAAVAAVLAQL
jgi:hypothetical protein